MSPTDRRRAVWLHNGLSGSATFAMKVMVRITKAPTVTKETAQLALQIWHDCDRLIKLLKTRRDI